MQDRETAHRLPLEFALSQLRHGYQQLHEHRVSRRGMREFADGIIAPAIRRMEQALASPLSAPPQEPTGASPQAETSEDEDDVPAVDSWSAPLRKPVVPKILSTDDFYALLRILEVLPVADPFLTGLQAKLSDEERRQHGNRASHLSGPEFVREIERIEALIQSRQLAPVSPVEPTGASPQAETSANVRAVTVHICDDCLHLRGEMCHEPNCRFCRRTMVEVADYLDVLLIRPRIDGVSVLIDEGSHLPSPVSPVEPEPCVWRDDHGITRTTCGMTLPEGADDHTYCGYCGAPLKVER